MKRNAGVTSQKISPFETMAFFIVLIFMTFLFSMLLVSAQASTIDFTANFNHANTSAIKAYNFSHSQLVRVVLFTESSSKLFGISITFAFSFYCNRRLNDGCLLAIIILDMRNSVVRVDRHPQVVWMANHDCPVKEDARLSVAPGKGLVLTGNDGEGWVLTAHAPPRRMILGPDGLRDPLPSSNPDQFFADRPPALIRSVPILIRSKIFDGGSSMVAICCGEAGFDNGSSVMKRNTGVPSQKIFTLCDNAFFIVPIFMNFLFSPFPVYAQAPTIDFTANYTTYWTNANTLAIQAYNSQAYNFRRGQLVRVVLFTEASSKLYGTSIAFAFGFYYDHRLNDGCLIAIIIFEDL